MVTIKQNQQTLAVIVFVLAVLTHKVYSQSVDICNPCSQNIYASSCGQATCISGYITRDDFKSLCSGSCASAISGPSMAACLYQEGINVTLIQNAMLDNIVSVCEAGFHGENSTIASAPSESEDELITPETLNATSPMTDMDDGPEESPHTMEEDNSPQSTLDESPEIVPIYEPEESPESSPGLEPEEVPEVQPDEEPIEEPAEAPEEIPDEEPEIEPEELEEIPEEEPEIEPEELEEIPEEEPEIEPEEIPEEVPEMQPMEEPEIEPEVVPEEAEGSVMDYYLEDSDLIDLDESVVRNLDKGFSDDVVEVDDHGFYITEDN